jgi:hypothetical protein
MNCYELYPKSAADFCQSRANDKYYKGGRGNELNSASGLYPNQEFSSSV